MLFFRRKNRRRYSKAALRRRLLQPLFERLEDRLLMATVNWIGGSGDWNIPTNWRDDALPIPVNRLPGPDDDAVIDVAAAVSVTHSSGSHTVKSLTLNEPFALSGGTLIVTENLVQQNANTFAMTGGILRGAKVAHPSGAVLVVSGGTLDGVTLGATIGGVPTAASIQGNTPGFSVTGGLTFVDGSLVDLSNQVLLNGDQTLGGAGEIRFRGGAALLANSGQTTFGPGLTIHRSDTAFSNISIGNGASIVNRGTIRADAGGTIRVLGNLGSAFFTNAAGGVLAADGGTLWLGADWSNAGQIVVNNSTLNLDGAFTTAGIGSITRTGGTINLRGLLDNSGDIFALDATTGSWNLGPTFNGRLRGGALVTSGGAVLMGDGGTLDGVTLGATVGGAPASATVQSSNTIWVTGGLTFVNGSLLDLGHAMFMLSDQTLGGDGEIRFRGSGGIGNSFQTTFGPGLTIHRSETGSSDINIAGGSLTNQATIRADAGGEIRVTGNPASPLSNAVGGVLSADGGTLSLLTSWRNTAGQIVVNNSTLNLGGSFTTAGIGSITRTGGTINLVGLLDNTGDTFVLDATTGSWNLNSGLAELRGGNIVTSGGAALVFTHTNTSGTLNGVTLGGTVGGVPASATVLGNSTSQFLVTGGLTFTNGSLLDTGTLMTLVGDQTVGGAGEIRFRASAGISSSNQTTFGPGLTIHRAGAGSTSINMVNGNITNQATIRADAGGQINMAGNIGTSLTNAVGGVLAADGGTLSLTSAWSNAGQIVVNNSTLNLGGSFTTAGIGILTRTGGTINLTGLLDNTGGTLALDAATGSWNLTSGTLYRGALVTSGGAMLVAAGGTLDGVTLGGFVGGVPASATVQGNSGGFNVTGGLTFANGSLLDLGNGMQLFGGQTLGGDGEIRFRSGAGITNFDDTIFGPGLTIHRADAGSTAIFISGGSITNQATIRADAGGQINVSGTFTNAVAGVLEVAGGNLHLGGNWSNAGAIQVTGGTLNLRDSITWSPSATLVHIGGSVNVTGTLTSTGTLATAANMNLTGTISGGTFSTSGMGKLLLNGGTLQGVTLTGVAEAQTNSFVEGGLTLHGGQLIVNANRKLTFQASNQELTGQGTVVFAGTGGALEVEANRQLTIGAGVIIVATTGTSSLVASASGASGVNYSTISTAPGATVSLVGNWADHGTRIVPGGSSDGGPITRGVPTPGRISVTGEMDNWTYFARAGQALSIFLNPANGVSPALGLAQLQILDPANNVIGTAAASANGQSVQLVGFTFPTDGTYTLRVQASPVQATAVGNYLLSAYEATPDTRPLVLNQQVTGLLESYYSTDRWTFSASANQQVQFHLLGVASTGIRFRLTGPNGFVAFTDLNSDSGLVNLPATGSYVLQAAGNLTGFGAYTFRLDATSPTVLALGTTYNGSLSSSGFVQLFKVDVPQSAPLLIHFDDATDTDRTEVYAQLGSSPTRQTFDARFDVNGADHLVTVPFAAPGTWYVLVYGERVASASNFTLLVESVPVRTLGVTPNYGGVGAPSQVTLTGLGFVPGTQFNLVPVGGGAPIPAAQVGIDSTTQATVTFDLAGAALGNYDIRATLATGPSSSLPGAFQVGALAESKLETRLILPSALGRHAVATLYVEYANTGNVPMTAPILTLQSGDPDNSDRPLLTLDKSRVIPGFWTLAIPDGFAHSAQIYASGAAPGMLQPGERIRVPVYYAGLLLPWDFSDTGVEFELRIHSAGDTTLIDWPSLATQLRPSWITTEVWPAVVANLQSQIGTTWGDYLRTLSDNARYLSRLGANVSSAAELYAFELQEALGLDPVGTLASAVDASAASPGLPLSFSRSFGNTIRERYRVGPFGRGWNTTWQQFAELLSDGTVIVYESADAQRRFQPDSRRANTYFSQTGDTGTLRRVTGGAFELTETSGAVIRFRADGRLDLVRDTYGNSITAGYTNNRLTSLTHSSGLALGITYNAAGHIASITDPFGRTTTFGYDPTDSLLLTATDPAGTTTYTYSTGNGDAREYALTSVTDPSGVTQSFEYDVQGRLTATFIGANIGRTSFAYDNAGTVTITDAANVFSKIFFDHNRQVTRVEDSTGYYVSSQFDANFRPVTQVDALGASQTTTWTTTGAVRTLTDELGAITTFTPGGPLNQPLSFSDARGSTTRYTYNTAGDVTATTYADNSVERATYDLQGTPDVLTNRRGQTNDRTVNASGQVTHETRSDGTSVDYTYDTFGRLRTATDAGGTTTLSYDAADRLTRVEYPNGRWLQYTYDAAGRRTRLEDHTGFAVQYTYDSASRMERVLDAANALIVRYSYDAAGRLSREDKGNGTSTVYGYDAAGRVVSITHRAPDNSVNAAFGYTYDSAGRRITAATPDGTWTYSYDLTGQLIRAVFASTNPGIPNQDLTYVYDALGNRVRTVLNGVTANYTATSLNQTTAAGSTTFRYDLDGNLVQETGSGGTKTYTYDLQNRLTRVQTPQGVWQYEYDVLGNRTAVIVDGQRTEYLIDPTRLGDVVGEYDGTGTRTSGYAHGLGLEGSSSVAGWGYFDFDALGSTAGISAGAGGYVNRYAYEPFGTPLLSNEGLANSFEFVGEFGVMSEGNGLNFMRARYYLPNAGRFVNQDPIRLAGGDVNLYRYVSNNPVNQSDPSGLGATFDQCGEAGGIVAYGKDGTPFCIVKTKPSTCEAFGGTQAPKRGLCAVPCDDCDPQSPPPPPPAPPPPPPAPPVPPIPYVCIPPDNCGKPPVRAAHDPNEKLGAWGFGLEAYIPADTLIPYRINFENLGPGSVPTPTQPATAPAQRVEVTDQLSTNLDWDTFEFTEFGFGDTFVPVSNAAAYYFTSVPMTFNDKEFNVDVEMSFDSATGLVRVVFQALDPATSLPPDVLTGILPPEDGTGAGKGYFAFRVQTRTGLATGTEIRNIALIKFDINEVIATNQIDPENPAAGIDPKKEALNTIDAGLPSSSIHPLPAFSPTSFTVSWSGSDDASGVPGSGIASFDVFVSDNGAPFQLWLDDTTAKSALYSAQSRHSYAFYVVATDNVGHEEPMPIAAQATTVAQGLPTVVVDIVDSALSDADRSSQVAFIFSDIVTGFTLADVSAVGGSLSNFSGSGSSYSARFTANNGITVTGRVAVGTGYTDQAANPGTAGFDTVAIDTANPTVKVNIVDVLLTKVDNNSQVTFTFSEPVMGFTAADVTIVGGSLSDFSGSGGGYSAKFTASDGITATGRVTVGTGYTDLVGNQGTGHSDSVAVHTADDVGNSIYVLNSTQCAALDLSGTASIRVSGPVIVNSSCPGRALSAIGDSRITANRVVVAGGVQVIGTSLITPAAISGAPPSPDPLALLAAPPPGVNRGSVILSGASQLTIEPGEYSRIAISGSAKLTLLPGIYVIKGGGLSVSGSASLSGQGVLIYNAGTNFPAPGGSFGSISLNGSGAFDLTPATTGVYREITLFQSRDNLNMISLSGNASGMHGSLYAPKAQLSLSGNGSLMMTIIVDRFKLNGNAMAARSAEPVSSQPNGTSNTLDLPMIHLESAGIHTHVISVLPTLLTESIPTTSALANRFPVSLAVPWELPIAWPTHNRQRAIERLATQYPESAIDRFSDRLQRSSELPNISEFHSTDFVLLNSVSGLRSSIDDSKESVAPSDLGPLEAHDHALLAVLEGNFIWE